MSARRSPCGSTTSARRGDITKGPVDLLRHHGRRKRPCLRVIELPSVRGEVDPVGGEFDAGELGDVWSEDEREMTRAGVGVFEVGWRWRKRDRRIRGHGEDGVGGVHEGVQHSVVILEVRVRGNRRTDRRHVLAW